MAVHTITQNRYTTYALGLAVLCFTGYRLLTNQINWVGNWPLWGAVRWSDISVLELDRKALVLSRLLAVSLAVFLVVLTLALFRRREWDATRVVHRLRPRALVRCVACGWLPGGAPPVRRHLAGARGELGPRRRRGQETGKRLLAQEHGHLPRRQGSRSQARRARPRPLSRAEPLSRQREHTT